MLRVILVIAAIAGLLFLATLQIEEDSAILFSEVGVLEVDGNAEIVQASPDGQLLVHTNSKRSTVDIVSIVDPSAPVALASVDLPGEPTSVALSPDGRWALVAVAMKESKSGMPPKDPRLPGLLAIVDLADALAPKLVSMIGIGHHPDSIALATSGYELLAILAIENEPIVVEKGLVTRKTAPGNENDISLPGSVQIVAVNPETPHNWRVSTIQLSSALLRDAEMINIDDPQPEYVALSPGKHLAAVSLQENNGIVLIDPASLEIVRAFNLGKVTNRPADLSNDGNVDLSELYPGDLPDKPLAGTRFPDALAFSPDGQYILSADEGEQSFTGGRGISVWALDGTFIWDDGGEIERRAAELELYPDKRSARKGVEIEGITTGKFNTRDYAFAVSERGSFMVIYDISNPQAPEFVQILPTGKAPEGIVAIPQRDLVVVAAEDSGSLHIYQLESDAP
jgi:DNA-binding beta-propeller fold protein YncE